MYICAYNNDVNYQWDPRKARSNFRKHGVRFADVVAVFEDELAITILDDHPDEERYVTLGRDFIGRIIIVVYTWRKDEIRIISARKATSRERQEYEST